MKNLYFLFLLLVATGVNAQNEKLSSASEFIDRSSYIQINLDENESAVFKSGWNETVQFYPAEINHEIWIRYTQEMNLPPPDSFWGATHEVFG